MHSNHAGSAHARPEPAANEPVAAAKSISWRGYGLALGFVLEGFRISLRSSGLRAQQKSGREAALMR
jgi:hypothetical protein